MHTRRARRAFRPFDHGAPIRHLSAGPVAGVVLIVATLVAASYPRQTHAVTVELPLFFDDYLAPLSPLGNRLSLDRAGQAFWNTEPVDDDELQAILAQTAAQVPQPALWFEPDADAAYGRSAQVLALIERRGLTDRCFHFSNVEQFRPATGSTIGLRRSSAYAPCTSYGPE